MSKSKSYSKVSQGDILERKRIISERKARINNHIENQSSCYKLIIDLEMADSGKIRDRNIREIIEVGAILLDKSNEEVWRYKEYIKPTVCQIDKEITELTKISPDTVKDSRGAKEVLLEFNNKIKETVKGERVDLIAWSDSDSITIEAEHDLKDIQGIDLLYDIAREYIDLQLLFSMRSGIQRQFNLEKACDLLGMDFKGKAHDALIDAVNTSYLYTGIINDKSIDTVMKRIKSVFETKSLHNTLGSMIDFSQFKLEGEEKNE